MNKWAFPIKYREYYSVIKTIPTGLMMLMKSHMLANSLNICRIEPVLYLNGVDINSKKCSNKVIRNIFYKNRSFQPRGKFFGYLLPRDYLEKSLVASLSVLHLTNIEKYI